MPSSENAKNIEFAQCRNERFSENLVQDNDMLMEQILENVNNTPIGKVIKRIACLPEIRRKKVLDLRCSLAKGEYELNDRLDIALDRVLEDLTS